MRANRGGSAVGASPGIGVWWLAVLAAVLSAGIARAQVIKEVQMWPMRDGVRLSTSIYRPAGGGTYSTVLMRTPYQKDSPNDDAWAQAWVGLGYTMVIQNTRGRFGSEGDDSIFRDDGWGEHQDGYDTVEYIATRPWSDGNVGTFGASAVGITQEMMAPSAPPHLRCQVIMVASNDCYEQLFFQGGTLRSEMVENWLKGQGQFDDEMPRFAAHPTDDAFWEQYDALARTSQVKAPAFFLGGWYDILSQGTLDGFFSRQYSGGPGVQGENFLWIGPWTHGGVFQQAQGELVYPANAADGGLPYTLILQFLDHHLHGAPRPQWPPVTYYRMGPTDAAGSWWNTYGWSNWWPLTWAERPMYLHADGSMTLSPKYEFGFRDVIADPANPVPTVGGNNLTIPAGPFDQRGVEARPDVVSFQTAPLATAMEVTGHVKARLWAQSDAPDYDLAVRLSDVYPDGRSMLVLDGIRRARFGNGFKTEQVLAPGELALIEVDLWSTSIVFAPGHRIRLSISGSNSPRFDVNPNTGEPFRQNTSTRAASTRLWVSTWTPSALILPANPQLLNRR